MVGKIQVLGMGRSPKLPAQIQDKSIGAVKYPKYIVDLGLILQKRQKIDYRSDLIGDYVSQRQVEESLLTDKLFEVYKRVQEQYRHYKAYGSVSRYRTSLTSALKRVGKFGLAHSKKMESLKRNIIVDYTKTEEHRIDLISDNKKKAAARKSLKQKVAKRKEYIYETWGVKKGYMRDIIAVQKLLRAGLRQIKK